MDANPIPPAIFAGNPRPLSVTSSFSHKPLLHMSETAHSVAAACFTTLVNASSAIRYMATSVAADNCAKSPAQSRVTARLPVRVRVVANSCSAAMMPSSSSDAGRKSWLIRRTVSSACPSSARVSRNISRASAGSRPISCSATPSSNVNAARVGPNSSCKSRRMRRRSSSRALTMRSRACCASVASSVFSINTAV